MKKGRGITELSLWGDGCRVSLSWDSSESMLCNHDSTRTVHVRRQKAPSPAAFPHCAWRNRQERTCPGWQQVRRRAQSIAVHSKLPASSGSRTLCLLEVLSWVATLGPYIKVHHLIWQLPATIKVNCEEFCIYLFIYTFWVTQTPFTQECINICINYSSCTLEHLCLSCYTSIPIVLVTIPVMIRAWLRDTCTTHRGPTLLLSLPLLILEDMKRMFSLFQKEEDRTKLRLRKLIIAFNFKFTSS